MRILADENHAEKRFIRALVSAGHDVATVSDLGLLGKTDLEVMDMAIKTNRVVLTKDCEDFIAICETKSEHPGVLLHYTDPEHPLSNSALLQAIGNLSTNIGDISNQVHTLNFWLY